MKFAFVFPGQGSQSVGMMAAYGDSASVRQTFEEASSALGEDLWRLVSDGPAEALSQTVNTQPVMLAAGIAVWRLWREKGGAVPAVVAGHSLGEYSALVAAGVLEFAEAVPLVRLRAQAMQAAVPAGEGAMAAVLGIDQEIVKAVCAEVAAGDVVEPVNFNTPEQTVIAGHAAAVQRAADLAKARGAKRAVMLPVSAPFHCSLMRPAGDVLAARLGEIRISPPQIPVMNNADAQSYTDPVQIRDAMVRQAYSPVRWVEIVRRMGELGVTQVFECGPGKVLAPLTRRIESAMQGAALSDAAAVDQALEAMR